MTAMPQRIRTAADGTVFLDVLPGEMPAHHLPRSPDDFVLITDGPLDGAAQDCMALWLSDYLPGVELPEGCSHVLRGAVYRCRRAPTERTWRVINTDEPTPEPESTWTGSLFT